jgi:hypothetical protein
MEKNRCQLALQLTNQLRLKIIIHTLGSKSLDYQVSWEERACEGRPLTKSGIAFKFKAARWVAQQPG